MNRTRTAVRAATIAAVALLGGAPSAGGRAADEPIPDPRPGPARPTDPAGGRSELADRVRAGNEARQAGRLEQALMEYRAAAGIDPSRYEVQILIADTLRRLGRRDEAAAAYADASRLDPARAEGYTGRALLLRARYDFAAAAALVEAALPQARPADRADLLVSLGETRRQEGRTAEAADLFTRALGADPASAGARAGRARVAEMAGDLDAAIAGWAAYLEARPDDEAAALRAQELKELRASIAAIDQSIAGRTTGTDTRDALLLERARLVTLTGSPAAAADAWRRALRRVPGDATARRGLALALAAAGDDRAAASEFRKCLRQDPSDALAHYHLIALARRAGDAAAEEAGWSALVAARPGDTYALRGLAAHVRRAGAEARSRALAAAAGPGPEAARRRAFLQADAGDWEAAERSLYEALLDDATNPWSLEVTQEILSRRPAMLPALAERARAAARTAAPGDQRPVLLLARAAALAGQGAAADAAVRAAAVAAPGSAPAQSALAELLLARGGDPAPGLQALQHVVDLDPSRTAAHVDLALALLRAHRADMAAQAAQRGLAVHPRAAELLSLLGAARAEIGDPEAAARAYARALLEDPADNFHLARGQLPLVLAGLGRTIEARRALVGDLPEIPDLVYLEAWTFARDTFSDRSFHGQDWDSWRTRFDGRLATPLEAQRAIAGMLDTLGDPYTRLRDPEETTAVYLTRHAGLAEVDRTGRQRPYGRTVVTDTLPGNLGYIQITNFTDPNAVAAIRAALEAMREKEGIVIDLRGNPGGLARSADAVTDLLVGPGKAVGIEVTPGGETTRMTSGEGAVTDRPLTVLVDGQTGSAAERLAGSLEAAGRATLVGDPTRGKGMFQNTRVLPGGFMVLVSAGEVLGPDGRPIQGRGLRPRPADPAR